MSRVLGTHRKLTVTESFFMNSEAMSPNPAPWSQSRTRSRLVRIWTALDQENSPSLKKKVDGRGENRNIISKISIVFQSFSVKLCDTQAPQVRLRGTWTLDQLLLSPLSNRVLSREVLVKKKR